MAAEVDSKELMQATERKEESRYIESEQHDRIVDEYCPDEFQKIEGGLDKLPQATEMLKNGENKQPDCSIRDTLQPIYESNVEISEGESFLASPSAAEVVYKTSGMSANRHSGKMTFEATTDNLETKTNVDVIEELSGKSEIDSQKDLNGSKLDVKEDLDVPSRLGENVETEISIHSENDVAHSVSTIDDSLTVVTKDVMGKHESGLHIVTEHEEIPSIGTHHIAESTQEMEVAMLDEDETKTECNPSNFLVGETEGQIFHREGNSEATKKAVETKLGEEASEIKVNRREADDLVAKAVQVDSTYKEKSDDSVDSPFMIHEEKNQSQNEDLTRADTSEAQTCSGESEACIDKERHTEDEACQSIGLIPEHPLTEEQFQKETIGNAAEGDKYEHFETKPEASIEICSKESEDERDKCDEGVALQEEPLEMCGVNESNIKDHEKAMRLEEKDALSTDLTQVSNEENSIMILTDNVRAEDKCERFSKSEPDVGDKLSKETDQNHENTQRSSTYTNKQKENHGECMEQTCFEASIDKQEEQEPLILLPEENSRDAELNEVKKENEMETSNDEYRPEKSMNENEGQEKLLMSSNIFLEESEAHTFGKKAHQAENEENNNNTEEKLGYEKCEQVTSPEDVQEHETKVEKDDNENDNQPKDLQAAEPTEGCSKETSLPRKEDNLMEAEIKEVQEKKEVTEEEPKMDDCHSLEVSNLEIKTEGECSDIVAGDNALQEYEEQVKPSTSVEIDMKQDDNDALITGKKNDTESSVTDAAGGMLDQKMQEVAPDSETEGYKEVDIIEKLPKDTLQENLKEASTRELQEYEFPNAKTNEAVNKTLEKDGSLQQMVESTFVTNGADEVLIQKEDKLTEEEYVTKSKLLENATDSTKVQGTEDLLHTKVDFGNETKCAEVSREETREITDHTEVYQLNPLSEKLSTLGADSAEKESGDGMKHNATLEATADVEKDPGCNLEEHNETEKEGCSTEDNAQNAQMLNGDIIASGCIEMIQSGEQSETKNLPVEEDPGKQSERCFAESSDDGIDKPTNNLTIVAEESSKTNQDKIFEETGNCNDMMDFAAVTGATEITFRKAEVDDMPVAASAKCLDMGPAENAGKEHIQHGEEIEKNEMDKTSSISTFFNDQKKNEEENSAIQYRREVVAEARITSLSIQEYNTDVEEVKKSDISLMVENIKQAEGVKDISEALTKSSIQEDGTASADARTAEQNEQATKMVPQSTLTGLLADEPTNINKNSAEQVEEYSAKEKDMQQKESLEIPPLGAIEGTCTNEEDLRKNGVTSMTLAKEVQKDPPEEDKGKGHTTKEVQTMAPQEQAGKTESQETPLDSEENKEESVENKENSALLEKCGTSTGLPEIRECEVSTTPVCAVADSTTFEEVTTDCEPEIQLKERNDATDMALKISSEKVNEEQENSSDKEEVQEHKTKEAKEAHGISNVATTVSKETIPGSSSAENAKAISLQEQATALTAECEEISPDKRESIMESLLNCDIQDTNISVTSQETENPPKITEKTSSCHDANIGATVTAETLENDSEACFEKEASKQLEASSMEIPLVTESTTDKGDEGEGRTAMESHKEEPQLEEETEICIESDEYNEATLSDEQIKERNKESTEETAWQLQSHEGKVPELSTITAKDAAEDIKEEITGDSNTSHDKTDTKVEELCTTTKEYNQGNPDENQNKINTVVEALKPEVPNTTKCYDSPSGIEENKDQCTAISERLSLEIPIGNGSKITDNKNLNPKPEPVDEIERQCAEGTEGHDDGCNEISIEEVNPEHGKHNEIDDIKEIQMEEAGGAKDIQETIPENSPVNKGRDSSEFSETTAEICIREGEPGASIASEGETKANSSSRDAPQEHQNESNNNIEAQPESQEQEAREMQYTDLTASCRENADPATQREEVLKFLSENSTGACHGASEFQPHDYLMEAEMENVETKFLNIDSKPVDMEPKNYNEMELVRNDLSEETTNDDVVDKEVDAGQGKCDEIGTSNEKQKDEADDAKEVQETPTSSTISKERDIGSTSAEYGKVIAEVCSNGEEQSEHKLPEIVTEDNQGNCTAKESEEEANIQNEAPGADFQDVSMTSYVESREFCEQNMEVSKDTGKASDIMVEKSEIVNEVKPEIPSNGSLMEAVPTDAKKDNLKAELETSHSDPGNQSMKPIDENDDTCDEIFNGGVHAAEEKVDETVTIEEHETEEGKAKDIHVILATNSTINKERDSIAEHTETTGDKCIEGKPSASDCETEDNSNKINVVDEDKNERKVEGGPKPQFQEQELGEMKCADFPIISKEDEESSTQIEKVSDHASGESDIESVVTSEDRLHDTHTRGHKDAEIKNLNIESKLVDIEHEKQCEIKIVKEDSLIGEASDKEVHAAFEKAGQKKDIDTVAATIDVTTIHEENLPVEEKGIFSGSTEQSEMIEGKCIKNQESSAFTILKCEIEESGDKVAIVKEDQDESQIGDQGIKEEPQKEKLNEIRGVDSSQVSQENAEPCTMPDKESDCVLYKSAPECQPFESLKGASTEDDELKSPDVEVKSVDIVPTAKAAERKDNKQEATGNGKADESKTTNKIENSGDVMDEEVGNKSLEMSGISSMQNQEREYIAEHGETTGEICIEGEPSTSECEPEDSSNKRDVLDKDQNEGKVEEGPQSQFQDQEVSKMKCVDFPNISKEGAESSTQIEEVSGHALEKSKIKSEVTAEDQSHDVLTGGPKDDEIKNLNVETKLVDIEHAKQYEKEIVKEDCSIDEASDKVHAAYEEAGEVENKKDIDAVAADIDVTTILKERDISSGSIEQGKVTEGKCIKNQESSAFSVLKCETEESGNKTAIMKEDQDDSQIEDQKIKEETQEEELSEIGVVSSQVSQENAQSCTTLDKESDHVLHGSAPESQPHESLKGTSSEDAELKSRDVESESADTMPSVIAAEGKGDKQDEIGDKKADESETTKEHKVENSKDVIDEEVDNNSLEVVGINSVLSQERDYTAEHSETTGETRIKGGQSTSECETEDNSNKRDALEKDQKKGKVEGGPTSQHQGQEVSKIKCADFPNTSEDDVPESSTQTEEALYHASEKSKITSEVTSEVQSHDILTGGTEDADFKNLNVESKLVDIEDEKQCEIEIVKEDSSFAEASNKKVHAAFEKAGEIETKEDIDAAAADIDVTISKERDISSGFHKQTEVIEESSIVEASDKKVQTAFEKTGEVEIKKDIDTAAVDIDVTISKERDIFSGFHEQMEETEGKCIKNQESGAFTVSKDETEESGDNAITNEDQDEGQIEDQKIREEPQEQELSAIRGVTSPVSQENTQPCTKQHKESDHVSHISAPECQPHETLKETLSEDADLKNPDVESESADIVPSVIAAEEKDNKQDQTKDGKADEFESEKEHTIEDSDDVIDQVEGDDIAEHHETTGETSVEGEPSASECEIEDNSSKRDALDEDQNKAKVEEGPTPQYQGQEVGKMKCADFPNTSEDDAPESSTQTEEASYHASEKSKITSEVTSEVQSHDILTGGTEDADFKNLNVESKLVDIEDEKQCKIEIVKENSSFAEASDKKVHAAFEKAGEIEIKEDIDAAATDTNVTIGKERDIFSGFHKQTEVTEESSIAEASDKKVQIAFEKTSEIEIKKDIDVTISKERDIFSGFHEQMEETEGKCIKNQESGAFTVSKDETEESGDNAITNEDQDEGQIEDQKIREEPLEQELSAIRGVTSPVSQENAQPCTKLAKESDHVSHISAPECQPRETLEETLSEDADLKSPDVESESADIVPSVIAAEEKDNKQDQTKDGKADEFESEKEHTIEDSDDVIDQVERDNIAEHHETTGETSVEGEPSASESEIEDNSKKREVLDEYQNQGKVEEGGPKPQFQEQEVSEVKRVDLTNISQKDAESSTQIEEVPEFTSEKSSIKSETISEDQSQDILTGPPKEAEIKDLHIGSKLVDSDPEKHCEIEIVKDSSIGEASDKKVHAAFEKASEIEIKKDIDAAPANIDVTPICKEKDIFSGLTKQSEEIEGKCTENQESSALTVSKCKIEESEDKTNNMNEDQDEGQIEDQGNKEEPREQELSEIRGVVSTQVSQENAQPCTKESDHLLQKSASECQPGESLKGTPSEDAELNSPNVESESVGLVHAVIADEEKDNKQDETGDGKADESENTKVHTVEDSCDVIDEVVGDNSPEVVGNNSVLSQERDTCSVSAGFIEENCANNKHPIDQQKPNLETEANGDNKETINEDVEKGDVQSEIMNPKSLEEVTETKHADPQKNSQDNLESGTKMEKVSSLLAEESETCKVASEVLSSEVLTEAGSEYSESKHLDVASEAVGERNNITQEETPHEEVSAKLIKGDETAHTKECGMEKSSDAIHPVLTSDMPTTKEKDASLVIVEHAEALDLEGKAGNSIHASTAEVLEKEILHDEKTGISMEPVKTPEEDEKEIKEEAGSFYDDKHATSSTTKATEASSMETREDEEHKHMQDPDINETEFLEAERTDTSLRIIKEEVMVEKTSPQTIPQQIIQCENREEHSAAVQSPNEPVQSEDPGAKAINIAERAVSEGKLGATETERESATEYNETDIVIPQNGKSLIGEKITSEVPPIKDLQADVRSQTLATTMVSDEKEIELSSLDDGKRVQDAIQGKESLEAPVKQMEENEDTQDIPIKEDQKGSIPSDVQNLNNLEKERDSKCPPSVEEETGSTTLKKEASIPILEKITRDCEISGDEVSDRQIFGKQEIHESDPIHEEVIEERCRGDELVEEEISNKSLPNEPEIRNQESITPVGSIIVEETNPKEEVSSAENRASLEREEENRTIPDRDLQVRNPAVVSGGARETPVRTEMVISNDNENASPILKDKFSETLEKVEASKNLTEVNSAVEQVKRGGEVGKESSSGSAKEDPMSADASTTSLSDLLQKSTKDTLQMVKDLAEKKEQKEPKVEVQNWETEVIDHEEMKTDEEREELGEGENRETETAQDAPVLAENPKDEDIKVPHKKSHNILSGVGSKVKHSISKVKKAITGKSSHSKTAHSPK